MLRCGRVVVGSSILLGWLVLGGILPVQTARAQVLLAGEWKPQYHEDQPERIPGPDLGDYLGLPINDAARLKAESWDASRLTLPDEQCRVHVSPYIYRGPLDLRIWEEKDPDTQAVVAIKNYISTYSQTRTIWMDGRPHPSAFAPHTWMGFSTGKWEGNILTAHTTHIKQGWIRRNGLPQSDQATMNEHFIRHGDHLTHVVVLTDPVYLTEPLIKSEDFVLNLDGSNAWVYNCRSVVEINNRPKGEVPNYLPGQNPFMKEFTDRFKIPPLAALGGSETTYPEYRASMKASTNGSVGQGRAVPIPAEPSEIEILPVQGNVYMLAGAGGNVLVQKGKQGIVLIDSGTSERAEKTLAAIQKISKDPIRYLINTNGDPEHLGGNEAIANVAGSSKHVALTNTPFATALLTVEIIASESVLGRMSAQVNGKPRYASEAWPTETYVGDRDDLFYNGEAIQMLHPASAHTDGDTIAFFRRSDVIATGDLFDPNRYPVIDLAQGGSFQGLIDAVNQILDMSITALTDERGTMIVPGHGRICDKADLVEYRDMLTVVRDRMRAMIKKGMTLDQIQAARPTLDYDTLYGATSGPWTTRMFVEAAYKSLTQGPRQTAGLR